MKIYTKLRIDICTGEVLDEESFEYNGVVALAKGGGSPPPVTQTTYTQSPEERQMLALAMPVIQQIQQAALGGQPLWNIPQAPSMQGVLTGSHQYMPNANMLAPQGFSMLPQDLQSGILDTYNVGSRQLTESLGGSAGSARGGASGMLGGAQSDYWGNASGQMAMTAQQLMQPMQQAQYSQGMGQFADYQNESIGNYQNILNQQQQQLQASQFPYTAMPSFMGAGSSYMPTGITTQGIPSGSGSGFNMSGALGGVGMGAGIGSLMAAEGAAGMAALGPYGIPLMVGGGLMGGLGGGK